MSQDEFKRLIHAAETSKTTYNRGKLTGSDRAMLYQFAAGTGLRASELASLETDSLHFDDDPPYVVVEAAYSKRRRRDEQPMPTWLMAKLRTWLANRPAVELRNDRLWPGSWHDRAAEMLRIDLAAAEIPYIDERGEYFDFHALRRQYISSLSDAGIHPSRAQRLARHSSVDLTMNYYTDVRLSDTAAALGALPDPTANKSPERHQATGTYDRVVVVQELSERSPNGVKLSANVHLGNSQSHASKSTKPVVTQRVTLAEGTGLEPATGCPAPEFQSGC